MAALILLCTRPLCGRAAASSPELVQFQRNGTCLAPVALLERAPLRLTSCDLQTPPQPSDRPWLTLWSDAADALGSPQVANAGCEATGTCARSALCLNDDSVLCAEGNALFLHACQGTDKEHIHTANHFSWKAGRIVANFCPREEFCLVQGVSFGSPGGIELGKCTHAGATGWHRVPAKGPLPPKPPPPAPLPPPPPLPPVQPPCKDCPNIIFILTDDQDILLGGSLPTSAEFSPNATPLPQTRRLLLEQGAHLTNCFIHTPVWYPQLLRAPIRAPTHSRTSHD